METIKRITFVFLFLILAETVFAEDIVYKIGDEGPGGGIVFYYSKAGFPVKDPFSMSPKICHYLECSPVDIGRLPWCSKKEDEETCCDVSTSDSRGDNVGAGFTNTVNILKAEHTGGELTVLNCAAKACSAYFTGTTKPGEWYLPSKLELELINDNLVRTGIIIDKKQFYISSSQSFMDKERCDEIQFSVDESSYYSGFKNRSDYVRPVRAF